MPAIDLARELLAEQQLLIAGHTTKYWPKHLHLPGPTIDRFNHDQWKKAGSLTLKERAHAEVERRLAAYIPIDTNPQVTAELRRIIKAGMLTNGPLPKIV